MKKKKQSSQQPSHMPRFNTDFSPVRASSVYSKLITNTWTKLAYVKRKLEIFYTKTAHAYTEE